VNSLLSRSWFRNSILFGLFAALLLFSLPAFAAQLETELVSIPVKIGNITYYDDARIVKPVGDGPFPLILLTHGTPRNAEDRLKTDVTTYYKTNSEVLAGKGYVVAFVVRRGFGSSKAPYAETGDLANGTRNYYKHGMEAAKDLKAAIEFMKEKPFVNSKQIVLMGQSTGGHSVIATGSLKIDGVIAVVNFAGGRGSYAPDLVRDENNLIDSMRQYGRSSRIPTLWLYSENDRYFRPELAQAMYKAYVESGGVAKFIALPAYKEDGHSSFLGNRSVWLPYIDEFLREVIQ
jgi:dienelactone hydrolase